MVNTLDWKELIGVDLPKDKPITEETRTLTKNESSRFRGSVRLSTGRIWTEKEYEEHRKLVLNTPLP